MIFYIADTHFGHENVIKFDGRPFNNAAEMDRALIENWNTRVTDNDDVYILGDFCLRSEHSAYWYLKRLKGRKHLIIGNHDGELRKNDDAVKCFETVEKMLHVKDGKNQICLCHFPIAEWNGFWHGSWHIYGHIHNSKGPISEFMKSSGRALNAGCMINNYMPVTFNELVVNNKFFNETVLNEDNNSEEEQ